MDAMPLGVGYIKAVMDEKFAARDVQVRIFAYPDVLLQAIEARPPHVLMVGNYMWNESLGHFFLRRVKKYNPDVLAIMGGPNISKEPVRQLEYVATHPEIDLYIHGEADFTAAEIVDAFVDSGRSIARLMERELPSSVYRRNGELVRSETRARLRSLDDIVSPYLSGAMDEFFDGRLAPMLETNRGCPFKCKFCVQGTEFYNKVTHFDLERLRAEIEYIARTIHERSPEMGTLRIADPNFGMYSRDVAIAEMIGQMQKRYGWPTFIDATTGKNKPERIIECLEKVNGALVLYQAVQSLDDEVLRNIDRSNIKLDAYQKIMVHVRGRGLRSNSDLILGLPGETKKSHLRGLYQLIDAGTDQAHCFQAMVLKGSDLETVEVRERYQFLTRFRVLPKNYGIYGGEKVFDIEEIIVGSDTLPFDDYVECRKHHMTFSVFWNDSWFADVVAFAAEMDIKPSKWLQEMLRALETATSDPIRELLDGFVGETVGELFETRESCEAFYAHPDNFERLGRAEIGDNLMYKYRAKASFFVWKAICAAALEATRQLVLAAGAAERYPDFNQLWNDFHSYVECKHASGDSLDEVLRPVSTTLNFDIPRWIADGFPHETSNYRNGKRRAMTFRLSEEGARELESAFRVWSSGLAGLTKLVTRIRVTSQIRTCEFPHVAEPEGVAVA
ncbi:MAG: radical SAM protein [Gammaproteobacteria bacterium]|nr:radical SAM protein [Gammaproteobacteria bacterium]